MKFIREKLSRMSDGKTEVRYTEESSAINEKPFVVVADQEGVRIYGFSPVFSAPDEFRALAKAIGDAGTDHVKLKPKLARTGSGH